MIRGKLLKTFLIMICSFVFCSCGKSDTNTQVEAYDMSEDASDYSDEDFEDNDTWAYYDEEHYDAGYDYEADEEFDELFEELREESKVCSFDKKTGELICRDDEGCGSRSLAVAKTVLINNHLTKKGIKTLEKNRGLKKLRVKDLSNLSEEDKMELYLPLARGDIGMAAVLFAYEDYSSSVGNNGTRIYRRVMKKKCPSITILRSCASVVSGAICAAGASDYASAATAGLVSYFEGDEHWRNMGKLPENKLKSGDIIFIDRKSHIKDYQSGRMEDSEHSADKTENKVSSATVHDHVLVWVGNEKIRRVFPDSDGNSVSGSYSEAYKTARSAAIGKYNLTGDYRIYRYKP